VSSNPPKLTLFEEWCDKVSAAHNGHPFDVLTEKVDARDIILPELVSVLQYHYDARARFLERAARLGYDRAVEVIRQRLPTIAIARSGDIGEILATEYVNSSLPFVIPINRLQWKDGRNTAMRGDDLIGFRLKGDGKLDALLKGESKSRIGLYDNAMAEAVTKLREYDGRPSPHTLMYLVDRLKELGQTAAAEVLEDYALLGGTFPITHFIFTLSGNAPQTTIQTALTGAYLPGIHRQIVGLVIADHKDFIEALFEIASA
jgi:hypothetical protein